MEADSAGADGQRGFRRRWIGVFGALLLVTIVFMIVIVDRRQIASYAAERYLAARGVPARIRFDRLDPRRIIAFASLGPSDAPDATMRVDATVRWRGLAPRLVTVAIESAHVRARIDGGRMRFGTVQRLLESPVGAQSSLAPPPRIILRNVLVTLTAPNGHADIRIDGDWNGSVVRMARATVQSAVWRTGGTALIARDADLRVEPRAGELTMHGIARLGLTIDDGAQVWHSDSIELRVDGQHIVQRADGSAKAPLTVDGQFEIGVDARRVHLGGADAQRISIAAHLSDAHVAAGNSAISVRSPLTARIDVAAFRGVAGIDGLTLPRMEIDLDGQLGRSEGTFWGRLRADSRVDGAIAPKDLARLMRRVGVARLGAHAGEIVRAMSRDFTASMTDLRAEVGTSDIKWRLVGAIHARTSAYPARIELTPATGEAIAAGEFPLAAFSSTSSAATPNSVHGAFRMRIGGAPLPNVRLEAANYQVEFGGARPVRAEARFHIDARLPNAPVKDLDVDAQARLKVRGSRVSVVAKPCARVTGDRLVLAGVDVRRLGGEICDATAQLVTDKAKWTAAAAWRGFHATLPSVSVRLEDGDGFVDLAGDARGMRSTNLRVGVLHIVDGSSDARFGAMAVRGRTASKGGDVVGEFALRLDRPATALAQIRYRASFATNTGEASFETERLEFAPGGLQPASLTRVLRGVDRVSGRADLAMHAHWSANRLDTNARVRLANVGFASRFGDVSHLDADVELSSLDPPRTSSPQKITIGTIGSVVPVSDLAAQFALQPGSVVVSGAQMRFAGGTVSLDRSVVPLDPAGTARVSLKLRDVDLNQILAVTTLSHRIDLAVHVSGELPLTYGPTGLRFDHGELHSVGPGHIAIDRSIWGDNGAAPINAVRDFAYQAMEHLRVKALEARINSENDERVRVILHVQGENAPPIARPARVGLLALLRGHAFDRPVPLPKGTPIDLTLDSALNVGGILDAYRAAWRPPAGDERRTSGEKPR